MSTNPSHTYISGKSEDKFSGVGCETCTSLNKCSHEGFDCLTIHIKRSVIFSSNTSSKKSVKREGKRDMQKEKKKSEQSKATNEVIYSRGGSRDSGEATSDQNVVQDETRGRDTSDTEEKPGPTDRKKDKKKFADALKKRVSALRNTGGGRVLIHVDEQKKTDRNLQFIDECMVDCLISLISDGSLYADNFKRLWLSDLKPKDVWGKYQDVVLLTVEKANALVTVDFNSKVRHDHQNVAATTSNIVSILLREKSTRSTGPKPIGNIKDIKTEDRNIELKSFTKKYVDALKGKTDVEIADYIWSDLKLKDNIASMSKIQNGGSYILGYDEGAAQDGGSKKISLQGIHVDVSEDDLKHALEKKIKDNILVLEDKNFKKGTENLFQTIVHHVDGEFVLEVAIGFCKGLVFTDFEGPRTYHLVETSETSTPEIERMTNKDWLKKMMENCYVCNRKLEYHCD